MKKQRISFRYRLEYAVLRVAQAMIASVPLKASGVIVSGVLHVTQLFGWPCNRDICSRMRDVFGQEMTKSACRKIALASAWNLIMNFVELFHAAKMDEPYLRAHLEGAKQVREALHSLIAKHGGVVIALPHMGNWDLGGIACTSFGIPLMALARAQNNPLVENWLRRNRLGNFEAVDRRFPSSFVRIAHHLKGGGAFAILPDVRHNKPGVGVTVFGKPDVQLGKGLAKFARMGNVPILPLFLERKDANHHVITFADPIYPDLEADADADATRLTQAVWDLFEPRIRQHPEQWFWFNRRWILTPLYTKSR